MPKKDPCKVFACKLQKCLEGHNFQPSACEHVLEELTECCRKWREKSFVCEGIRIEENTKK